MTFLISFFTGKDLLVFPLCLLILFYVIKNRANMYRDYRIRNIYFRSFYFKMICVLVFTLLTEFYFKGGDTSMFYQATKDLRAAIADKPENLMLILKTRQLTVKSPLFDYFYYDGYVYDIIYNYMLSAANFIPPKLALVPSYLFWNSYICINVFYGFFALGGAIRLFKTFLHFYPQLYRELALACLFLPGVCYWSAGLLKDPITFGCVGYILYAFLNIAIKKKKILVSVIWIIVCGLLLFFIKVYILLVLLMTILVWQFAEFNKLIKNKTLRNIFAGMTLVISLGVTYLLLNYFTSFEAAQQYQLDKVAGNAEYQRRMYADIAQNTSDSHFTINTSNPILMVVGGVSATFFRPFLWEINSPIAFLSAAESLAFFLLTLNFMIQKGVKKFFTIPFSDPRMLMCFVFSFVFAVAVGTASANFGALSRYKIPCMPFYLIMIILLYHTVKLEYPRWFKKIIDFALPPK
ncbi:MAG TPA: hypothetical protein VLJ68_02810 [Chitinophagaceae bacterium]|nr:hypothetical protein [Chitinophagaceae bacterium]